MVTRGESGRIFAVLALLIDDAALPTEEVEAEDTVES